MQLNTIASRVSFNKIEYSLFNTILALNGIENWNDIFNTSVGWYFQKNKELAGILSTYFLKKLSLLGKIFLTAVVCFESWKMGKKSRPLVSNSIFNPGPKASPPAEID